MKILNLRKFYGFNFIFFWVRKNSETKAMMLDNGCWGIATGN